MSKKDAIRIETYLEHILEAIKRINEYTYDMIDLTFYNDKLVQDAVIRNFEIIGEAACNIDRYHSDFLKEHPELPFRQAYEMRNSLAHGYFKTDFEIVWNTIENDLPLLDRSIKKIYKKMKQGS